MWPGVIPDSSKLIQALPSYYELLRIYKTASCSLRQFHTLIQTTFTATSSAFPFPCLSVLCLPVALPVFSVAVGGLLLVLYYYLCLLSVPFVFFLSFPILLYFVQHCGSRVLLHLVVVFVDFASLPCAPSLAYSFDSVSCFPFLSLLRDMFISLCVFPCLPFLCIWTSFHCFCPFPPFALSLPLH